MDNSGMPTTYDTQGAGGATTGPSAAATGRVFFDRSVVYQRPMQVKLAIAVLCVIGLIATAACGVYGGSQAGFYNFIAGVGLLVALGQVLLVALGFRDTLARWVPLALIDLMYAGLWALFFMCGSIACAVHGSSYANTSALIASAFFGFLIMALYLYEAKGLFFVWRSASSPSQQAQPNASTPTY